MKKRITTYAAVAMACILTGCGVSVDQPKQTPGVQQSTTEEEFSVETYYAQKHTACQSVTEAVASYTTECKELGSAGYQKLNFKNCVFQSMPQIRSYAVLQATPHVMSREEGWKVIEEWANQWSEKFHEKKIPIKKLTYDANGGEEAGELAEKEYPACYPLAADKASGKDDGSGFFINTKDYYIQLGNGIYSMSDGTINRYLKADGFAALDALGGNEADIVKSVDLQSDPSFRDKAYRLLDDKVKVKDAEKVAESYFEKGTPYPVSDGIKVKACFADVFRMGNRYGYALTLHREYQNIPFAAGRMDKIKYSEEQEDYKPQEDAIQAYIADQSGVCAFTGNESQRELHVLKNDIEEMLDIRGAADCMEEQLAQNLNVDVQKAGLVYCPMQSDEGQEFDKVCWQFVGMCTSNQREICVYVDVLTGDITYYTYTTE